MRILLAILLILNFSLFAVAQQSKLDSLHAIWEDVSQSDSNRSKAFNSYIENGFLFSNPDSAFALAQKLLRFGEEQVIEIAKYNAFRIMGMASTFKSNNQKALEYFQSGLKISEKIGDKQLIGAITMNMGIIYNYTGAYHKALECFQSGLDVFEEYEDQSNIANTLGNMGVANINLGNAPKALEFFQRALAIKEKIGDKQSMINTLIAIGNINRDIGDISKALENYQRSLLYAEETNDKMGIAKSLASIGNTYSSTKNLKALDYYMGALKIQEEFGDKMNSAKTLLSIGSCHNDLGDNAKALKFFQKGLKISEEIGDRQSMALASINLGNTHRALGDYLKALEYCHRALLISEEIRAKEGAMKSCNCLYLSYKTNGDSKKALKYHEQMIVLKDSLFNEENTKKLTQLEMQFDFDKKEAATKLGQEKKDALAAGELRQHKLIRNGFVGGFSIMLVFAIVFLSQRNKIRKSKKQSDDLLLNILPAEVAEELKNTGTSEAQQFDQVSILFTDFKSFTQTAEKLSAKELVNEINTCFKAFDNICEKYGIEKIKTIGDSYMCASGLGRGSQFTDDGSQRTVSSEQTTVNLMFAALEMQEFITTRSSQLETHNSFLMRAGIHTGPVVAGIVGIKKFQYDIWGDTVNTASRMESHGEVGKVNISEATYELLKNDRDFAFESRGKIEAKGKGEIEMYFVSKA